MVALRLAWASYKSRGRTLVLVFLPIALLFSLVTMMVSLEVVLRAQAAPGVDERLFRISPNGPPFLTAAAVRKIQAIPGVANIAPKAGVNCTSADGVDGKFGCFGTDAAFIHMCGQLQYVPPEALAKWNSQPNGVIVGRDLAAKYNFKEGQPLFATIDKKLNSSFIVSYVTSTGTRQGDAWMHVAAADSVRGTEAGTYQGGWVETTTPEVRDAVIKQVEGVFENTAAVMTIVRAEDMKSLMLGASSLVVSLLRAAGVLSLGLVLFVTLAVLTISTEARRVEIATLLAIGFKKSTVLATVSIEAVMIVLPGAFIGSVAVYSYFSRHPFRMDDVGRFSFQPTPADVAFAVLGGIVMAAMVGAVPGRRAASIDVLDAIRGG